MLPNSSPAPPNLPTPRRTFSFSPRMEMPATPAAEDRGQHFFSTPTGPGPVERQQPMEETVIPLGENDIDLLVARFGAMPSLMLPDTIKKFEPSSAAIAYTAHMDRYMYGLSNKILGRSREVDPTTARQVTISRPPIDNCSWWVDLSDDSLARLLALPMAHRATKLTLYACKDEVTAAAIKKRNYSNQSMEWHEDETNLPPAIKGTKTHEDGPDDVEPEAPTIPRLPTKLPDGVKGQTPEVGIITQFERVVIVEGHTYSPYREWTTARRKAANISKTQSTLFGRKCRMYAYVRSQPDVVALPVKVKELERDANAWIKSLSEEEQAEWEKSSYDSAVAVWTALQNV